MQKTCTLHKIGAWILTFVLALSLTACQNSGQDTSQNQGQNQDQNQNQIPESEDSTTIRIAALKGPTSMGLIKLINDTDTNNVSEESLYDFTLAGSADEISPAFLKGDLNIACIPANLASVFYNKTEGQIATLAINTLGVLYIVENGDGSGENQIKTLADLQGKTIVAAGKGATPEYSLRYLLKENGLNPDEDIQIDWKSEHSECVAALASGAAQIALLPQPFVTAAQNQLENLNIALDLNAEWEKLNNNSALITGVTVVWKNFLDAHPERVNAFLQDYADSVNWVNENHTDAANLIAHYGIVEAAPVAEKALPYCNIVCITGQELSDKLSGYLQVLYDADPTSVGDALPESDFYYQGDSGK